MPEDYQAILSDLGVDTSNPPADNTNAGNTDATNVSNEGSSTATPEVNNGDNNASTQSTEATKSAEPLVIEPSDEQKKQNEAFASLRTENSRYKKFLQQIMKGANYQGSEQDFMKALEEESYKRQAQSSQVSPELLKRMDALENQNSALIESQNRQTFMANLQGLQETFKLTDKDIKEFVDLAVREHIDLTAPGTNFVTLYQGLFFNKLKDKMIEEARQEWIAQNSKANNAANPDGKSGKKDPEPTNVNTMAEFNSLLQSMPINNK